MDESEFHRRADEILARIERAAESAEGIDSDLEGGVLTLECPDGSKVIVNRQAPHREIWVAARSGGHHFAWRDGAWRDTRSGRELFTALAEITAAQGGEALRFG
jgi:CyaY protein